jgi:hypothetical protein
MKKFAFHLYAGNKFLRYAHSDSIPRVGDEIRLSPKSFVAVEKVVLCWDETSVLGERVNLLVKKIKL